MAVLRKNWTKTVVPIPCRKKRVIWLRGVDPEDLCRRLILISWRTGTALQVTAGRRLERSLLGLHLRELKVLGLCEFNSLENHFGFFLQIITVQGGRYTKTIQLFKKLNNLCKLLKTLYLMFSILPLFFYHSFHFQT